MRLAVGGLARFIATPAVSKYRLFVWMDGHTLADHALVVVARDDDYTFGVLHSRVHEAWALAQGTQLETRPRYTPTTTFETFPFPRPTEKQRLSISAAATRLVELRDMWLKQTGLASEEVARRTLTDLYNERPAWLDDAHATLDDEVLAAYGWPADLANHEILARLLDLNRGREPA